MIPTIASMYFVIALSNAGAESAAAIEMRCGAQFVQPAEIVDCLSRAADQTQRDLDATETRLFQHLRRVQNHYPELGELNVGALEPAWQQASQSWQKFKDDSCAYYTQLHSAIGEGDLERAACVLRAVKRRLDDVAADEAFWRDKFPVGD